MDEERQVVVELDAEQLPAPAHAFDRGSLDRAERRIVGLQCIDSRGQRGLDSRARNTLADPACGDLDFR
jgi:hypothetical protein